MEKPMDSKKKNKVAVQSKKRQRLSPDKSRQLILEASLEIINKNGWSGLSIPNVAKACQTSPANVLYHFKNREGLLGGLLEKITLNNHALVSKKIKPEMDALEKLYWHFQTNLEWAREFPEEAQILIQIYGEASHNAEFSEVFRRMLERAQLRIYEHLVAGQLQGIFAQDIQSRVLAKYLHNTLVGAFIAVAGSQITHIVRYPETELMDYLKTVTQWRPRSP
jgi:AcrR family transcriptional regulator